MPGIGHDAAGNLTSTMFGGTMYYDLASRLASVQGMSVLRYTARNERLVVNTSDGTREVHMRGLGGEMIGVYRIDWENGNSSYTKPVRLPERERVYAAGRLLFEGGTFVATDRLGSVVYKFGTGLALVNGGMETGVAPWYAYYGAQAEVSYVPHTGGRSLRVTTPIVDRGVYQEVKGLVAGLTYQFQAWVRAESGTSLAALAVCDSNYTGFVWTGVRTATTDWQLLSVTFTATAQGVARVHLAKHDTTGALLWDDVELVNGATATSGLKMRYYPYGQEVGTATANDTAKFGTYTRDANSGLDYAMNRYYQSWWGRFTTADPYRASGGPADPGSWNRYSYVQGDPVNYFDPTGLQMMRPIIITSMQCGFAWSGPWDDGYWYSYCNYGFSVIWDGGGGVGGGVETPAEPASGGPPGIVGIGGLKSALSVDKCAKAVGAQDSAAALEALKNTTFKMGSLGKTLLLPTGKGPNSFRVVYPAFGHAPIGGSTITINSDINWLFPTESTGHVASYKFNPDDMATVTYTGATRTVNLVEATRKELELSTLTEVEWRTFVLLHEFSHRLGLGHDVMDNKLIVKECLGK